MVERKGYLSRKAYNKARWKKKISRFNIGMEKYFPGWLEEHEMMLIGKKVLVR